MKLEKIKARGVDNLYRSPKSGIIYFRKYRKGFGETYKSTRTRVLEDAKRFVDDMKLGKKTVVLKGRRLALEMFDVWLANKETLGASKGTITSIRASRAHLAPFLEMLLPEEITAQWWAAEYIPKVREKTHAKRKFFNDRKWLTSFMKSLVESGAISRPPKFVNPDPKTTVGKVFTDDEVSTLIEHAQSDDLKLAILMAATMGMRRLEIFALKCDRVDMRRKVIRLRREDTKTRKARAFAISPATVKLILERCESGSPWVFPSATDKTSPLHKDGFKTAWTNLKRHHGIEGRFHDLRHTFLTKAFKAPGANPALICTYAGLSLEVAERTYLHLTEDDTKAVSVAVSYA